MIGLEVIYKNGVKDYYDPICENDIREYQDYVAITHANGYKYFLLKVDIEKIWQYVLCEKCNHPLDEQSICQNCQLEK
jgi:hypothetical protein